MSEVVSTQLTELMDLARAQLVPAGTWSLATDPRWLGQVYAGPGVRSRLWRLPTGGLRGSAAVGLAADPSSDAVTVTSMLRPGSESLWAEQQAWIDMTLDGSSIAGGPVLALCESLTADEAARWRSAGYALILEELVMERALTIDGLREAARWPAGANVVEWSDDAAAASFEVYEAAFRERPGFPGWSRSDWIERMTGDDDFLPEASICVLVDGIAAGYVASSPGWIHQVGVVPAYRRTGLASALVTEALARLQARGHATVHLHVNSNNPAAVATWQRLGFAAVGRRGRFERDSHPR